MAPHSETSRHNEPAYIENDGKQESIRASRRVAAQEIASSPGKNRRHPINRSHELRCGAHV